ncbi:hypothetical protein ACIGO9_30610 [Nocardia asteroides]|uniref:hypothetical protein n=1 Tax=Nocardia asteroides TaxID=1824 RepID=UPI0037C96930
MSDVLEALLGSPHDILSEPPTNDPAALRAVAEALAALGRSTLIADTESTVTVCAGYFDTHGHPKVGPLSKAHDTNTRRPDTSEDAVVVLAVAVAIPLSALDSVPDASGQAVVDFINRADATRRARMIDELTQQRDHFTRQGAAAQAQAAHVQQQLDRLSTSAPLPAEASASNGSDIGL